MFVQLKEGAEKAVILVQKTSSTRPATAKPKAEKSEAPPSATVKKPTGTGRKPVSNTGTYVKKAVKTEVAPVSDDFSTDQEQDPSARAASPQPPDTGSRVDISGDITEAVIEKM